jgi:hypothetical protein
VSEFFGMVVYMYWMDVQRHRVPHIHVRYQGREAVFSLEGECLEGTLGPRANRLVADWCSERDIELRDAWARAIAGKEIPWIAPLQ